MISLAFGVLSRDNQRLPPVSYFELTLYLKLESAVTQSRTAPSSYDLSSAAFTAIIAESNFRQTEVSAH